MSMSTPVPVVNSITIPVLPEHRSAVFHPTIWGDHFLRYDLRDDNSEDFHRSSEQHMIKGLVNKVEVMLAEDGLDFFEKMNLIDQLQRLGVAYLFQAPVAENLDLIYENNLAYFETCGDDLWATALLFRLLRQRGYPISAEVFNKFKDKAGWFRESLHSDVRGLLSLYEASHFMVHGEDILEEALTFTTTHLESIDKTKSSSSDDDLLVKMVHHALKQPMRKGLPRLEARHYIPIYKEDPSRNNVLYSLAVLDFNSLQRQHQQELARISRWWKDLDVARKFPFARDRIAEAYFWILGLYFEPELALARRILCKVTTMISIIDDIYDVHGMMGELQSFARAVERWDRSAVEELPEYMKWFYNVLLDVYDEIYAEMVNIGQMYRHSYAVQAMKSQVKAYFEEAKWYHQGYIPPMEEYMQLALLTCGYRSLSITSFVGLGDEVTEQDFQWVTESTKMVRAIEHVSRLMDDVIGHEFEQKRGHVASAVKCYMKEHLGVTEEEAKEELNAMVFNAWKDINEECLRPTPISAQLLTPMLNLARVMDVLYKDRDNYSNAGTKLKEYIKCMLVEPLLM